MEIITLVIIALSILSIGLGLLFGLFRGFGNSLLRLGLIVVSIICFQVVLFCKSKNFFEVSL